MCKRSTLNGSILHCMQFQTKFDSLQCSFLCDIALFMLLCIWHNTFMRLWGCMLWIFTDDFQWLSFRNTGNLAKHYTISESIHNCLNSIVRFESDCCNIRILTVMNHYCFSAKCSKGYSIESKCCTGFIQSIAFLFVIFVIFDQADPGEQGTCCYACDKDLRHYISGNLWTSLSLRSLYLMTFFEVKMGIWHFNLWHSNQQPALIWHWTVTVSITFLLIK